MSKLSGKRVAILASNGFEESELLEPLRALRESGAEVDVVSPEKGSIQGMRHFDKGEKVDVDQALADADASDYDALVIPGGLFNPDALRADDNAVRFTRAFFQAGKPVGAICHGPWVLVNADVVGKRELTSVQNIQRDLENAGARWVDREVVVDQGLVTSRTPDDLPAFCSKLVEEIAEGRHKGQERSA
ncbi:intracellular protease, PfpI family [Pseudoxanthomonas suwonensis 11-1]|uniref:Intracellular protease, PfpI family n=1 Tax=Pseudoxanthomonas suwonensis (strain 11-1) TaxID=743721 RepID=E6WSJ3_PSEUU|nr:type 1 glutamine amidotransferase domain-containing protein [Pseudoxanthomonas suwonensis]ADV27207.1 intracellular protease, PfpI family [Pseudoxanthomonas suwonensis 11-1]